LKLILEVAKRFTEFHGNLKNFYAHGRKLEIFLLGAEQQNL
jgi:hypothetical protein